MKHSKALNTSTATNDTSAQAVERPAFPQALLDHVIAHYKKPADLIGENGMLKQLTKAVFEAGRRGQIPS